MKSMKERLLWGVFRIGRYYAWWVVLTMLLLTGLGIYYARDVPLRSSVFDLLPADDPLINQYRENEEYLAQSDYVGLLVTLVGDIDEDSSARELTLLGAAKELASSLLEDPEFVDVIYQQESSPSIPAQYEHVLDLSDEELNEIQESLAKVRSAVTVGGTSVLSLDKTISSAYAAVRKAFDDALYSADLAIGADPAGVEGVTAQLAAFSAMNEAVLQTIAGLEGLPTVTGSVRALAGVFDPTSEDEAKARAYFSTDRAHLLMVAQPRYPLQRGVEYATLVTERAKAAIERSDPDSLGVRVGVVGTYVYQAETNAVVNADMLRTTVISSIGVFVIFLVAFGSLFYSIIAVIPVLISVVWTMSWAKFAFGGFNLVTTLLPALVLGLGIDYAIHLISRYAEERSAGKSLNRALHAAVINKGEASFVAAATTALVFVGLLTSRSRAMFEMGAITSVGVMVAFLVTLFLVPALITLSHHVFRARHRETISNYTVRLSGVFRFVTGKGRAIFVIILILTFFVAFQAARTSFVFSSTDLVPRVKSTAVLEEIIAADFPSIPGGISSYFTFYASTGEELRDVVGRLSEHDLIEGEVESALELLPVDLTEAQQVLNNLDIAAYVRQLEGLQASLDDRTDVIKQTQTLLAQASLIQYAASLNGQVTLALSGSRIIDQLHELRGVLSELDVDRAKESVLDLRNALLDLDTNLRGLRELPPVETLLREIVLGLPEAVRNAYLTPDGEFVIRARVSREIYLGDRLAEFDRYAASFSDNYFGMPLVAQQLETSMKRDFYLSTVLAAVIIVIVLWRSLNKWMRALLAAAPLILGYIWMLGGMRLLSIDFNFLSIIISPLLIGIGVDNGIHVLHRTAEERVLNPNGAVERGVSATAVALIVTSLTTMLVFGSLLAARTPGLRMLGGSALLGIGFSLLFSLLFLPAAMRVEGGKRV